MRESEQTSIACHLKGGLGVVVGGITVVGGWVEMDRAVLGGSRGGGAARNGGKAGGAGDGGMGKGGVGCDEKQRKCSEQICVGDWLGEKPAL